MAIREKETSDYNSLSYSYVQLSFYLTEELEKQQGYFYAIWLFKVYKR